MKNIIPKKNLLWMILAISSLIIIGMIIYKLEIYPGLNSRLDENTLEMAGILILMFFLIFVVLYIPTGSLKKMKKDIHYDGVEVEPVTVIVENDQIDDEVYFTAGKSDVHETEIVEALPLE